MGGKVNIAIVGLGFGAEFIPIYQRHPHANMYAICQRTKRKLDAIGDSFGVGVRYTDFDALLKDKNIDAVHINTPIPDHAPQAIKALKAGKHVACTVPMATTVAECQEIVKLAKKMGKKYMMMETVVYSRDFLFIKELYDKGELGKIQFVQASHQQDMDGWPNYWPGLPPMYYATHCVGPCLALTRATAEYVSCFGSGRIREELIPKYNSPFAVETTHIKFKDSDICAESIGRSSTPHASIARASTCTAPRKPLNGPWSRAKTRSSIRPRSPSRRFRRGSKCPTMPTGCRSRSACSPPRECTIWRSISICRSRRAAATAARIRTWRTSSS